MPRSSLELAHNLLERKRKFKKQYKYIILVVVLKNHDKAFNSLKITVMAGNIDRAVIKVIARSFIFTYSFHIVPESVILFRLILNRFERSTFKIFLT